MQKIDHLDNAYQSIRLIRKNLLIYVPDVSFLLLTFLLSALFLYFNNLTHIFTGELDLFGQGIKNILNSTPLLVKFIVSLLIIGAINLLVGLGTVTWRFTIIKDVINNGKINFRKDWDESTHFLLPVLGLKAALLILYLIPAVLIFGIALIFKPSLFIVGTLLLVVFIIFRLLFLFSYPIMFLKNKRNPFEVLNEAFDYFKNNKSHTILTGLFILLISGIIGILINTFIIVWGSVSGYVGLLTNIAILSLIFILIKNLIDISVNLWSNIFIFKNY